MIAHVVAQGAHIFVETFRLCNVGFQVLHLSGEYFPLPIFLLFGFPLAKQPDDGKVLFAWHPLIYKFISNNDKIVWFRVYVIECVRDSLFGFFLMYVGVRFLLRVYGKKQEHMKLREFLILTIPIGHIMQKQHNTSISCSY